MNEKREKKKYEWATQNRYLRKVSKKKKKDQDKLEKILLKTY